MHGYSRIGESGETGDRHRPSSFRLGEPFLDFKAGGACPITLSHQLAELVGVSISRHRKVPELDGPERKRKFCRIAEGSFVVFINFRTRNALNDFRRPIHTCTFTLRTAKSYHRTWGCSRSERGKLRTASSEGPSIEFFTSHHARRINASRSFGSPSPSIALLHHNLRSKLDNPG